MLALDQLDALRAAEIDRVGTFFPAVAGILEIGAGTGKQALELQQRGYSVTAMTWRVEPTSDLPSAGSWRVSLAAPATSLSLCWCRNRAGKAALVGHANSRAMSRADRPAMS